MVFNFGWIREGELAGMGYPDAGSWPALAEQGIRAVVSLTRDEAPGDPEGAGLEVLHAPIPDFGTPSDAELRRTLRFMKRQIDAGRAVVVHCRAGQGRTGLILAAYLVYEGLTAEAAIREVRRLRPGSIETAGQRAMIERFAQARGRAGDGRSEEGA